MKSLKKTMTKAASKAMAGVGMTSGVAAAPADARAGWEDFSDFSNAVPIGGGASLGARAVPLHDGLGAEMEPHPLTKDWAARIKNPKVRAAFAKQPLESYADAHALNVWTGTWNTNGKPPPASLDISAWLDVASSPDLVVVGFQEIVPLTPGKVLMQEDAQATGEWEAIIERCLNGAESETSKTSPPAPAPTPAPPAADGWTAFGSNATFPDARPGSEKASAPSSRYVRVACKQLVGVYITVWASRGVSRFISDVRVAAVATGVNLGVTMLGNKGGAAVWLKVHNTPLCFVCAHLSAGSKENDAQKRSEDYREIFSKLSFPPPPAASSDGSFEKPAGVADAFAAVWIGDLNYRLNLADDFVRSSLAGITSETSGRDVVEDFRVRSAYAAERTRRFAVAARRGPALAGARRGQGVCRLDRGARGVRAHVQVPPGHAHVLGRGRRGRGTRDRRGGRRCSARGEREGGEEETHAGVVRSRVVARTRRDADVVRRDARVDAQRPQARVQLVYRNRAAPVPAETADRASGDPARAGRRGDGVAASVRGAQPARRVRGTPLVRRAEDDDVPAGQHRGRAGVVELCRRGSG
jgi:phosphatidylinositol-bisphosphatase